MYLPHELIRRSLSELSAIHPFFGLDFLVFKQGEIPIGTKTNFPINSRLKEFMTLYYKPDLKSTRYFQPFKTSSREGPWVTWKYPFSGAQKTRTSGRLAAAFLHDRNTDQWGWRSNYVEVLREELDIGKTDRISAFWLATWLYRHRDWPDDTNALAMVRSFLREFHISKDEVEELFRTTVPDIGSDFLVPAPYSDDELMRIDIGRPPDAEPEEGGTLRYIEMRGIGPVHRLEFDPAERLSVITGDNGLGKTFILECAWWSLTGEWPERQAYPRTDAKRDEPSITFAIAGHRNTQEKKTLKFDWNAHRWPTPKSRPTIPGLSLYARVDGSFAIFDPVRHSQDGDEGTQLVFTRDQVMDGRGKRINGLIHDWVNWQRSPDQSAFETFKAVLKRLSPPDMNPLEPGEPTRIANDAREIPTLKHDYDVVPFTNESAGVRRIVTVAYLLVWVWNEHKIHSGLSKKAPQRRMVILIDEMEAHLHPKWQRVVLPALLDVTNLLGTELEAQIIIATHSPLILASLEQEFHESIDKLFHLQMSRKASTPSADGHTEVKFGEVQFIRHGRVDAWLTSEVFELKEATSQPAELALARAKTVMGEDSPSPGVIREITNQLSRTLPADDEFWPRWLYFAKQKGVAL